MKTTRRAVALMVIVISFIGALSLQAEEKKHYKTGILLVTFGTTFPEACAAFDKIDARMKDAFPDTAVRWAYTSEMIREKMAEKGKQMNSPSGAIDEMADHGFERIAVQSLHTIAGYEFHNLVKTVKQFKRGRGKNIDINISGPLLAGPKDMEAAADAVSKTIPDERKPQEAVVLMGHGTHHPANSAYAALMWRLQRKDENIFMGTVEGFPGPETILEQLKEKQISSAWLMPFMSVAGDHARNDMAGNGSDSWKTLFTDAGIECRTVLRGFAEYDEFTDIWIEQLKASGSDL